MATFEKSLGKARRFFNIELSAQGFPDPRFEEKKGFREGLRARAGEFADRAKRLSTKARPKNFKVGMSIPFSDEMMEIARDLDAAKSRISKVKDEGEKQRLEKKASHLQKMLRDQKKSAVEAALKSQGSKNPIGVLVGAGKHTDVSILPSKGFNELNPDAFESRFKTPPGIGVDTSKGRSLKKGTKGAAITEALEESGGEKVGGKGESTTRGTSGIFDEIDSEDGVAASGRPEKSLFDKRPASEKRLLGAGKLPPGVREADLDPDSLKVYEEGKAIRAGRVEGLVSSDRRIRTINNRVRDVKQAIGDPKKQTRQMKEILDDFDKKYKKILDRDVRSAKAMRKQRSDLQALLGTLNTKAQNEVARQAKADPKNKNALLQKRQSIANAHSTQPHPFINAKTGKMQVAYEVQYASNEPVRGPRGTPVKTPEGGNLRSVTVYASSPEEAVQMLRDGKTNARGYTGGMIGVKGVVKPPRKRTPTTTAEPDVDKPVTSKPGTKAGATVAKEATEEVAEEAVEAAAKKGAGAAVGRQVAGAAAKGVLGRAAGLLFGPVGTAATLGFMAYGVAADKSRRRQEVAAKNREIYTNFVQKQIVSREQRMERARLQAATLQARKQVASRTRKKISPELAAILGNRQSEFIQQPRMTQGLQQIYTDLYR